MNDQDYIRKAVELADGWTYHDGDCLYEETTEWFISCKLPQVWKDALAAQLVRQVDALSDYHFVSESYGRTAVIQYRNGTFVPHVIAEYEADDRTMNTIKTIDDSKVLGEAA